MKKQLLEKTTCELRLHQECKHLEKSNNQVQEKLYEQYQLITDLEKSLAIIFHQMSSLQSLHNEAQDNIRHLSDEKIFITHEKLQLEGQLKQLDLLLKNYLGNNVLVLKSNIEMA